METSSVTSKESSLTFWKPRRKISGLMTWGVGVVTPRYRVGSRCEPTFSWDGAEHELAILGLLDGGFHRHSENRSSVLFAVAQNLLRMPSFIEPQISGARGAGASTHLVDFLRRYQRSRSIVHGNQGSPFGHLG
eukprot:scaffold34_cov260-Pinguiococcus_pyrenoidosus.AAC.5